MNLKFNRSNLKELSLYHNCENGYVDLINHLSKEELEESEFFKIPEEEDCFICLLEFDNENKSFVDTLRCGHEVHCECADKYFEHSKMIRCKCGISTENYTEKFDDFVFFNYKNIIHPDIRISSGGKTIISRRKLINQDEE